VEASVFASLSPPRLAGARCGPCGTVVFPRQASCPRCGASTEATVLPASGRVWTWTVQHFAPKTPYRPPGDAFAPFAVGYVDLGEVMVETRLAVLRFDVLRIGLPVRLTLLPVWHEPDGAEVATYAFTPETNAMPQVDDDE